MKTTLRATGWRVAFLVAVGAGLAAGEPCAIRVTTPSQEVWAAQCSCAGGSGDTNYLLGYTHGGDAYVAFAASGKWLKIAFDGREGWIPAAFVVAAPGTAALRFPSDRSVRAAAEADEPVLGAVGAGQAYAILADEGAVSRIVWGGAAVWVDSADAERLAPDGDLDARDVARAPVNWDPCLDKHNVRLVPGAGPWKLVKAEVHLDNNNDANCSDTGPLCPNKAGAETSGGRTAIYFTCLDESGKILCAPAVKPVVLWPGGSMVLTDCKANDPFGKHTANFPMNAKYDHCKGGGALTATIDASTGGGDRVEGLGLPYRGHHHAFYLTFQRSGAGGTTTIPPAAGGGTASVAPPPAPVPSPAPAPAASPTPAPTSSAVPAPAPASVSPVVPLPIGGGIPTVVGLPGTTSSPSSPGGGAGAGQVPPASPPQYTIAGNNPRAGYRSGGADSAGAGGRSGACWAGGGTGGGNGGLSAGLLLVLWLGVTRAGCRTLAIARCRLRR